MRSSIARSCLAIACWSALLVGVSAQCGALISTFPYQEGFEAGPAWTAGGTASDWAWGTPAKALISSAGEGNNSWCVGGLTGSAYSNGQQSWLESPCFDLASLAFPYISFKLFWETERGYDGLGFQYSVNEGQTWANVGQFSTNADCLTNNWFNSANITGLNLAQPKQGWSGRVGATAGNCAGGDGSGQWLTATHCLGMVAGATNVKFRFIFGAGTICNGYDGIAIDDVRISEAPVNLPFFTYSCNGSSVTFQDDSGLCPTSRSWDFGDPASGAANSSTATNPTHLFSAPGTYQVQLTVSGPCNGSASITLPITILEVDLITTGPGCAGNDGSIEAVVSGGNGPFLYFWNPGGQASALLDGLSPGDYNVVVEGNDACPAQASATLVQQNSTLVLAAQSTNVSCSGFSDGSIAIAVSGGSAPYTYLWAPGGETTSAISGLQAGGYSCSVSDADGCTATTTITITEPTPLLLAADNLITICAGTTLSLDAQVSGGTSPYALAWYPEGPVTTPLQTTVYTATASDAQGCTAIPVDVLVEVVGPAPPPITVLNDEGCVPHCVTFATSASGMVEYLWSFGDGTSMDGSMSTEHCFLQGGNYTPSLSITDGFGCSATTTLPDAVQAFPTPVAQFTLFPEVATIDAPDFRFLASAVGIVAWEWNFGDALGNTASGPDVSFSYNDVACYEVILVVSNSDGCTAETSALACVEDEFAVYAPNAFTPNGDGINDGFGVVTTVRDPKDLVLEVYDRWGRSIFRSTDVRSTWDGRAAGSDTPDGVYIWQLRMRDAQGQLRNAQGHVLLMR